MTSDKHRASVSVPLPPIWAVVWLVTVAGLAVLVYFDREEWHWYYSASQASEVAELSDELHDLDRELSSVDREVGSLERRIDNGSSNGDSATARLATAVAVLALADSPGGPLSSGSAQGRACFDWLTLGEGSGSDCGFILADD